MKNKKIMAVFFAVLCTFSMLFSLTSCQFKEQDAGPKWVDSKFSLLTSPAVHDNSDFFLFENNIDCGGDYKTGYSAPLIVLQLEKHTMTCSNIYISKLKNQNSVCIADGTLNLKKNIYLDTGKHRRFRASNLSINFGETSRFEVSNTDNYKYSASALTYHDFPIEISLFMSTFSRQTEIVMNENALLKLEIEVENLEEATNIPIVNIVGDNTYFFYKSEELHEYFPKVYLPPITVKINANNATIIKNDMIEIVNPNNYTVNLIEESELLDYYTA